MVRLLNDGDLRRILDVRVAIGAVERALRERAAGSAVSLPRSAVETGSGALVFAPGGFGQMAIAGLRVYPVGYEADDQVVATWDMRDGRLQALFVGSLLGTIRTGAIGGAAMKLLAPSDASVLAVLGTGPQGYMQALAAVAVRPVREVRIYRRTADLRRAQAWEWTEALGVPVRPTATVRQAVSGASLIVMATRATTPVLDAGFLEPGVHVNSLGPKWRGDSEVGMDLMERAEVLVSDFPEQYRREEEFILHGSRHLDRLQELAALFARGFSRRPDDTTVFLSHGLSGTEVAVGHALAQLAEAAGAGVEIEIEGQ